LAGALIAFGFFVYKTDLKTSVTQATDKKYESMKPEPTEAYKSWATYAWVF
jgi:hypothetical protein